jgi:hypothetical protein
VVFSSSLHSGMFLIFIFFVKLNKETRLQRSLSVDDIILPSVLVINGSHGSVVGIVTG